MLFNSVLPPETVSGTPRMILTGDHHLLVESHCGLISYSDTCLMLRAKQGLITCRGKDLILTRLSADDAIITGSIQALEFKP